jgi:hypothetical protein
MVEPDGWRRVEEFVLGEVGDGSGWKCEALDTGRISSPCAGRGANLSPPPAGRPGPFLWAQTRGEAGVLA